MFRAENALNSQSSLGASAKNRTETVQVAAPPNLPKNGIVSTPEGHRAGEVKI